MILWNQSLVFSTKVNKVNYNGALLFEPPKKIPKSEYICDTKFNLATILDMYKTETAFGLVLISGKEARMYQMILSGSHKDLRLLYDRNISLAGRTRRGGQSALRIDRLIEEKRNIYLTELAETMVKIFLRNNNTDCIVKDMVIAGPANIKKELYNKDLVQQYFSTKIKKFVDTDNIKEDTAWEVFNKSLDVFTSEELDNERKITEEVKNLVLKADDRLVFGKDEILSLYEACMLSKVVVINNIDLYTEP